MRWYTILIKNLRFCSGTRNYLPNPPPPQPQPDCAWVESSRPAVKASMCQATWCPSCKAAAMNQRASPRAQEAGPLPQLPGAGELAGPGIMAEGQVFTLTVTAGVAGSFFLKGGTNSHFLSTCSSGAWGSRAVIWGLWRNPTPPPRSQVNVNGDRRKNLSSTSMPPSPGLMTVLPKKSSPSHTHQAHTCLVSGQQIGGGSDGSV